MVDKPEADELDKNPWTDWAENIRAIAQNGLTFSRDEFDLERYHQLQTIAHEMTALLSGAPIEKVDNYFLPDHGYATPKVDLRGGVFLEDKRGFRRLADQKSVWVTKMPDKCQSILPHSKVLNLVNLFTEVNRKQVEHCFPRLKMLITKWV